MSVSRTFQERGLEIIRGKSSQAENSWETFYQLVILLAVAKSHAELLLIDPQGPAESFEDFTKRVKKGYLTLSLWVHADKVKNMDMGDGAKKIADAVFIAVNEAYTRLSDYQSVLIDKASTKNGVMYKIGPHFITQYYPILDDKRIKIEIPTNSPAALAIFSKEEIQHILRLPSDFEGFQAARKRVNLAIVPEIERSIAELSADVENADDAPDETIEGKFSSIYIAINAGRSLFGRQPQFPFENNVILAAAYKAEESRFDAEVKKQQLEDKRQKIRNNYINTKGAYAFAQEAGQFSSANAGLRHRSISEVSPIESDVLQEDDLKPVEPRPSFWKRHRNKFIIAGVGLLVLAVIAVVGAFSAPALAVLPFFAKASFGILMSTGLLVSSKVVLGSVIAGAAVVAGGIAAGMTAAVLAVKEKFFGKKPSPDVGPKVEEVAPSIRRVESDAPPKHSPRGKGLEYQSDPNAAWRRSGQFGTAGRPASSADSAPPSEPENTPFGFDVD